MECALFQDAHGFASGGDYVCRVMAENRSRGASSHNSDPTLPRDVAGTTAAASNAVGPSVARVTPTVSLVEWHAREKQEQIDRLLEMLDDLRQDVVAGRVTALALAGVADEQEFFQWEGKDPTILYVLELAKAELIHGVRFASDDEDDEDDE